MKKSICLISPGHLGSNPRLVKEADALQEAGYTVHVIYGETHVPALGRDRAVLGEARWTSQSVSLFDNPVRTTVWKGVQRVAWLLFGRGFKTVGMARRAVHPLSPGLRRAALTHRADLYLGHCLPSLPLVVEAARRHGARCGFDAEDFHSGESEEKGRGAIHNDLARILETRFLRQCDHFTAASPLIAEAYATAYGVRPTSILNVFPLRETVDPKPAPPMPSFYWFSQTVGSGRGLESFVEILKGLDRPIRIDLRGHVSGEYRQELECLASGSQVSVGFLPPDAPASMVPHAAGYTAGLSLEKSTPKNRDICLTNKAFTYLLAGIPVILSKTRAQEKLAKVLGDAALLVDTNASSSSAMLLGQWLDDSDQQMASRIRALRIGREEYNWDREKKKFLARVERTFDAERRK